MSICAGEGWCKLGQDHDWTVKKKCGDKVFVRRERRKRKRIKMEIGKDDPDLGGLKWP